MGCGGRGRGRGRGVGWDEGDVCWRIVGHNQCGMPLVELFFRTSTRVVIFLIFK